MQDNIIKKKHRVVKEHNGETGRGRKVYKFYPDLDNVLWRRPASLPTALLGKGTSNTVEVSAVEQ